MAKYKCPIATCNVSFEGSPYEIAPMAIGHAHGSHQTEITEGDVFNIIEIQSHPDFQKTPTDVLPEQYRVDLDSWWKKISG